MTAHMLAIVAFGLLMMVYLGAVRAREIAERTAKARAVESQQPRQTFSRKTTRKRSSRGADRWINKA